ncbi:Caveolin [Dirofilaria immitis]|nr:Caveolin [Dirofilaria immitis]
MVDRKEEIQPEQVPLKSDSDPEKLNDETNFAKNLATKSPRSYNFEREQDGTKKSGTAVKMNFENRDDKGLNNHIIMDFGEVFAEPDGSHSFNWIWFVTNRIFTATSVAIYKLLAALIAIPFAVLFGILFAIFAVISVFLCTPLGILLGIPLSALSKEALSPISASIRTDSNYPQLSQYAD